MIITNILPNAEIRLPAHKSRAEISEVHRVCAPSPRDTAERAHRRDAWPRDPLVVVVDAVPRRTRHVREAAAGPPAVPAAAPATAVEESRVRGSDKSNQK